MDTTAVGGQVGASPARECGPACDIAVQWASNEQTWENLTFLHWRYDPAAIQALLPPRLTVETFDGAAWVALVPFHMRVSLPRTKPLGWLSCFPETNVRTYVVDENGRNAVWFFSLDATHPGAVAVGRGSFGLPYYWSWMSVRSDGERTTYRCVRWWPGRSRPSSQVVVRPTEPYLADELGAFDHWLTARFRLYAHTDRRGLHTTLAEHGPWPLRRAEVLYLRDELIEAAGLPAPDGPPLVHHSDGVHVRIGWPERVR